jgi:hypothetical protein
MLRRAALAVLLATLASLGRADAQGGGGTTWEGSTKDGSKVVADFDGKNLTVFKKDVCSLDYYLKASLAKPLKADESGPLASCTMWRCTNRDLKAECPKLKDAFQVTCSGSVRVSQVAFRVYFDYPMERWQGSPKCAQRTSENEWGETTVFQRQPPRKPRDPSAPAADPTPTPGSTSGQSGWGVDIGQIIKCGVIEAIAGPDHPLCR